MPLRSVFARPTSPQPASARRRFGALLAAGATLLPLTLATPAPASAPTAPTDASAPAQQLRSAPPYAATLTPELIAELQRLRVPGGVVAVSTPGSGTWIKSLGTSDLATGQPMNPGDHFRIGSITKTFTATVILQLVQERLLTLDDKVSRFRHDVPDGQNITIRQLLNMTSGLYNYSEDLDFNRVLDRAPQTRWTPDQLLRIAFRHHSYFDPGCGFHYSNTNYVLLGLIIEQLTHRPVAYEYQQRIFRPLGMTETGMPTGTELPSSYSHGYQAVSNVASLTTPMLTGRDAAWADWSAGVPEDVTHTSPSWTWAAGEAYSDVHDLLRYAPALAEGTLLSPELQRERLTFVRPSPGGPGYGLGIVDFLGFLGHDGQIPGYNSFEAYDPALKATVVVLLDLNQSPDGSAPADKIAMLVFKQLFHLPTNP
ncbi:serine hydrolase domain-containing protein [Streptacidiphilus fuscans]|uniref:Beta-lactamase family protein n=1 Tax=Streptacidiphilus fuscans TaxID=2789292 RepID=A0A931BB10_9ACTN|nr:serine hydrolase domain-containing protein [Streptacidiphilus fuscans]MBF9071937.1 beta-lactamase family protein [Streptacidiphilus fuscans]